MLRTVAILLIAIFISVFLGTNFPVYLKLLGTKPDLFLIIVVFLNLRLKGRYSILFSGFLGFIKDVFCVARFGTSIISFIILSILINRLKVSIYEDERLFQVPLIFLASFLNSLFFYLLNIKTVFTEMQFFKYLFFIMLPESLYTTAASFLVFHLLNKCDLKFSIQ